MKRVEAEVHARTVIDGQPTVLAVMLPIDAGFRPGDRVVVMAAEEADLGVALQLQIAALANFIMDNVPGEPSQSEGAVECAIRLLGRLATEREAGRVEAAEAIAAWLRKAAGEHDDAGSHCAEKHPEVSTRQYARSDECASQADGIDLGEWRAFLPKPGNSNDK